MKPQRPIGKHYAHPPVIEALAEIYVDGAIWDDTVPDRFYAAVRDQFPEKGRVEQIALEIEVGKEEATASARTAAPRHQFRSSDGRRIVQISADVLVVNQLRPYEHYESWRALFLELLGRYRSLVKPSGVQRLGLRYINDVRLPGKQIELSDYFHIWPQVPDDLRATIRDFAMRLQLRPELDGHELTVTLGSVPRESSGGSVMMDIYDIVAFGPSDSFALVRERLDAAHAIVERTFERALTERSKSMFGEESE
jgi:uncharacterized protein (TIGR04255 family)